MMCLSKQYSAAAGGKILLKKPQNNLSNRAALYSCDLYLNKYSNPV
jgi:hypothetical protein